MHASLLRTLLFGALLLPATAALAQAPIRVESPRDWFFHLQFGKYYPQIDEEPGLQGTPFRDLMGSDSRLLVQAGLDRYLFKGFGTLGLGVQLGYSEFYGRARFADTGEPSPDLTSLHVVPIVLHLTYRLDEAAVRWDVPLVPYARVGTGAWLYWMEGMNGARAGYTFGGGLQFLLDVLDPRLAREFDRELGVNNSYFYIDYTVAKVDAFGHSDAFGGPGIVLSDDGILALGVGLDF